MDTNYKTVKLSPNLVSELEDIAKSKNTDIDNTIKLLLIENDNLKHPSYLTTTKVSKNKSTYSSVIPAPIKNKFNLSKGQVLYWDIEDNKIIITPDIVSDDLPETPSILAGESILTDILENKNYKYYVNAYGFILGVLKSNDTEDIKINKILDDYKQFDNLEDSSQYKEGYKIVLTYLLDQPLNTLQNSILKEVLNEINKLDNSSN